MRLAQFLTVLSFLLSLKPAWGTNCQALLDKAKAKMTDETTLVMAEQIVTSKVNRAQVVTARVTSPAESEELDILSDFTVPEGYAEHQARFKEAQHKMAEAALGELEGIRVSLNLMGSSLNFKQRLSWLAAKYDSSGDVATKAAVLAQLISSFSILRENEYIKLVATGPYSAEFKRALYQALSTIFKNDPSWQGPLEKAMDTAGVSR